MKLISRSVLISLLIEYALVKCNINHFDLQIFTKIKILIIKQEQSLKHKSRRLNLDLCNFCNFTYLTFSVKRNIDDTSLVQTRNITSANSFLSRIILNYSLSRKCVQHFFQANLPCMIDAYSS